MRRRRRIIAARRIGASVTSVVAVVALGVAVAMLRDPVDHEAPPFGGTTTAGVPPPSAESVQAALVAAVAARVPDAQWLNEPRVGNPPSVSCLDACPGEVIVESPWTNPVLFGWEWLTRSGRTARVTIVVHGDPTVLVCDESAGEPCTTGTADNGARLTTRSVLAPGGAVTKREVALELPGGRALSLAAEAPDTNPAAGPVLTEPELIDIVTDIAARIAG